MGPSDIVIISDGEEDEDGISFIASSSRIIQPIKPVSKPQAIFVDSDSETGSLDLDLERLPRIEDILRSDGSFMESIRRENADAMIDEDVHSVDKGRRAQNGNGKGKAKSGDHDEKRVIESRKSALLDILNDNMIIDYDLESDVQGEVAERIVEEGVNGKRGKKRKSRGMDVDSDAVPAAAKPKLSKEEKEALKAKEKGEKDFAKATAKAAKEAEKSYQKKVAEVNKLRISKNDTIRELALHLSHDLSLPTSPLAGALPEIQARLKENNSSLTFLSPDSSPIPGMIKFKRHVQARWDQPTKRFIPLDTPKWVWEGMVIIIVDAGEVVDRVNSGYEGLGLNDWVGDMKLSLGQDGRGPMGKGRGKEGEGLVLVIKGMGKYYSKLKSVANREFTAAARAGLGEGTSGTKRADGGNAGQGGGLEKEDVERALVEVQLEHGCFVVHVEKTEDMEDWIWNLAADIAIRPYKLLSKSHLNFTPPDHPRKAQTSGDALELMLQEVTGITPSAASGIAAVNPTFRDLMLAFEKAERRGGEVKAEGLLVDCEIKNLRNGTASGRKLNKALAKRVYNVFRGEDSLALA